MKRGYRLLASILALAFSFSLLVSGPGFASAEGNSSIANRFNVVMVIDKSGSLRDMNGVGTDPKGLRYDAMKLFLGLLTESGNNVGAVVFDDEIRYDSGLLPMSCMEDKRSLINTVEALGTSYDTDIGSAVLRATQVLRGMQEKNGLPCAILLLTDGMTDFPLENRWIRMQQSAEAAEKALQIAQDEGITIHGILLDVDGRSQGGEEELRRFTDGTDGEFESVSAPEDLAAAFRRFYSIINKTEYTGAHKIVFSPEGKAETDFLVPPFGVEEVNLVVEHRTSGPDGVPVTLERIRIRQPDGSDYDIAAHEMQTSRFLLVKLPLPAPGTWNVDLTGEPGDSIDVCIIYNASLSAALARDNAGKACEVLKPIRFTASVKDNDIPLTEEGMNSVTVTLAVKDPASGETREYPMAIEGGVFARELSFEQGGDYSLTATVEFADLAVRSNTLKLQVLVPPITAKLSAVTDLFSCGSIHDNMWEIALDGLFEDPKGTALRYALSDDLGGRVSIEDGSLKVKIVELGGEAAFTVTATDAYGLTAELPFSLKTVLPAPKLSAVTDILKLGRVRDNIWELELREVFDDPAGQGLHYTLSDELGGAVMIEDGVLTTKLAELGGKASFTVTAADIHGFTTTLPFDLTVTFPVAKLTGVSDIAELGRVRDNVWEVELSELFFDPDGQGLDYTLSDDFDGRISVEDGVLRAKLAELEGRHSFTVTAADRRGLTTSLPFTIDIKLPAAKVESVSDILKSGSIRDNVWSIDLRELFEDGGSLSYTLSDDFDGAISIEDSVLSAKLDELGGSASFTVTAADARNLTTALPFDLVYTLPSAKRDAVTDIEGLGQVRDNVWELALGSLFEDPKGTALRYELSDDLGGRVSIEDNVLRVKLAELDGKASFVVKATDEYGMSASIPFDLAVSLPKAKMDRFTDVLQHGRFTDDGWEIELEELFDDPAEQGLAYLLSGDAGGLVSIEDGVLKVRVESEDPVCFTVAATDARNFSTELPFELRFPAPVAKVEEVTETVTTGLLQDGVWEAPLSELFEDPKGSVLEFTVSDDLDGAVTITEDTIQATVEGLGDVDFTVTATDDFGLSTEIPVQLVEKDMTWTIIGIALLALILLIVIIVLVRRKKKQHS